MVVRRRRAAQLAPNPTLEPYAKIADDSPFVRTVTFVIAASNAPDHVKAQADFVCDGVVDEEEFNTALRDLPSIGGKICLSQGTFTFSATVTLPVKNNITIEGQGRSTRINYNGVNYVITSGGSAGPDGVVLQLFDTDAGGVDISGSEGSILRYWLDGVWTEFVTTPGVPQSRQRWLHHSHLTDIDLGTLPLHSVVSAVEVYVLQAFNDGGSNLLSVGGMWGAGIEADAYSLAVDVSTIGHKAMVAGARLGVPALNNNLTWVTYSGAAPTTGIALIQIFFEVAPDIPT